MISAAEANTIISGTVPTLGAVTVGLERSLHRVLAEDVVAQEQVPAFDNAQMDGYAVRVDDVQRPPVSLKVVGEVAAGTMPEREIRRGEAMRIMTGARVPAGSDAVIQQEWTEGTDAAAVNVVRSVQAGHNIRKSGSDIGAGSVVLRKGHFIRAQEIGVLASLGKRYIVVYRQAIVAILPTGNEIIEIDRPLSEGKVRNSNAYALASLVREAGGEPFRLDVAADEKHDLKEKILTGLGYDMLISAGGVSVGKYDLVVEVMRELGVEIRFWKVNIKPGMPLVYGTYNEKPVFGLPGNPVSAVITFMQFVRPALRQMMGRNERRDLTVYARLSVEIKKADGKRHFVRGILEHRDGTLEVSPIGSQVSNVLTSLTLANCLILLPEEKEIFRAGEIVEVELL